MIYDDVIMRTIIDLPAEQVEALAEICESEQISRAEAIRRAVADLVSNHKHYDRRSAFGAWKDDPVDSSEFVRKIRDEWN